MASELIHAVWDALPPLVASGKPVSTCMQEIAAVGKRIDPSEDWDAFLSIDYDASVDDLQTWIPDAVRDSPPEGPVLGLFMPLVQLHDVGYSIRLAGTSSYVAEDEDMNWVSDQDYEPRHQYANPPALHELSTISYDHGEVDYVMPLAFVVTTARTLVAPHTTQLINPEADLIGVVAGWEDGDFMEIGQLTRSGFRPETFVAF